MNDFLPKKNAFNKLFFCKQFVFMTFILKEDEKHFKLNYFNTLSRVFLV
jgi:hypothetical protein